MQTMMGEALRGGVLRFPSRFQPRPRRADRQFPFLQRRFTPRTVFMEVGGADCELALQAASYVERVYAIDVSGQFLQSVLVPCNLRLVLCDGVRIPVPEASVDVAWSGGFIDQLHPDDQLEHLKSVRRSLAPGGTYFFHSRAGSPREWARQAGFSALRCYAGALRMPLAMASLVPAGWLRFGALR
jgi:ubiquinone/menaquinone biosynthesis C-methylase UbiE